MRGEALNVQSVSGARDSIPTSCRSYRFRLIWEEDKVYFKRSRHFLLDFGVQCKGVEVTESDGVSQMAMSVSSHGATCEMWVRTKIVHISSLYRRSRVKEFKSQRVNFK
jgi:hypothetical protein